MMTYALAGLTLGFLSSGHCLGMCGPIAFTLGTHQLNSQKSHLERFFLFSVLGAAKALTYGWIGLLFGWAGHLVTQWSHWMGFAMALPWISGGLFVLAGLGIAGFIPRYELVIHRLENLLKHYVMPAFKQKQGWGNLIAIGMLWGLLPCPMVLAPALGAAVSGSMGGTQGAFRGFFMMLGFGLGTIPALYAGALAGQWLRKLRTWSPRIVGFCFVLLGIGTVIYSSAIMNFSSMPCHH